MTENIFENNINVFDRFTFDYLFKRLLKEGSDHKEAKDTIVYNCELSALVLQERIYNKYYLKINECDIISEDLKEFVNDIVYSEVKKRNSEIIDEIETKIIRLNQLQEKKILIELGERLYEKITTIVIPEWTIAFKSISKEDCIEYIKQVTIERTYDGFLLEKSVIYDDLQIVFPDIRFEESEPELDHSGDIDYLGYVGKYAFGIQIKPITAMSNFGNYNISDRMRNSFDSFEEEYGGKVFIVFSSKENNKKIIRNTEVIKEIETEIIRLNKLQV